MLKNRDVRWEAIRGKTGNGIIGTTSKLLQVATPFHKLQPAYIWSRLGREGTVAVCQEMNLSVQPIRHAE